MPRTKRKSPVEDVESAVADILNSPITRSNLAFLVRPGIGNVGEPANGGTSTRVALAGLTPMGGELIDSQVRSLAADFQITQSESPSLNTAATAGSEYLAPTGVTPAALRPPGLDSAALSPTGINLSNTPEPRDQKPAGAEPSDLMPIGAEPTNLMDSASLRSAIGGGNDHVNRGSVSSEHALKTGRRTIDATGLDATGSGPIGVAPTGAATSSTAEPESIALEDVLAVVQGQRQGRTSRIHRAERVEDGHSATQNTVYWCLWRLGRQVKGSRSRFVQAGYGQLQSALGIDRSNIQDAIRELQKKLSVRIIKQSTVGSATVYEVFSCEDILLKRRQEGLLWVRKFGTRRVDFVSEYDMDTKALTHATDIEPTGMAPIGTKPVSTILGGVRPTGLKPALGVPPTPTLGLTPTQGIGVTPIHSVKEVTSNNEATTAIGRMVAVLRDELGVADDDAAKRIYTACRYNAPNASEDEIIGCVQTEARRLRANRRVENPIGLLITHVPRRFIGESWRHQLEKRSSGSDPATDDPAIEIWRREQEAALNDPSVSEQEKRIIRTCLSET
jgi:hypothetical protein